jgi:hypothetical protein
MTEEPKTIVIVGTYDSRRVVDLATSLRRRGFAVLALENISVVGVLLLTQRVMSVIAFEAQVSKGWESTRSRLIEISPHTPIMFIAESDGRTADDLATAAVPE